MTTAECKTELTRLIKAFRDNRLNLIDLIVQTGDLRVHYTKDNKMPDEELLAHLFAVMEIQDDLQADPVKAGHNLQNVYDYCR